MNFVDVADENFDALLVSPATSEIDYALFCAGAVASDNQATAAASAADGDAEQRQTSHTSVIDSCRGDGKVLHRQQHRSDVQTEKTKRGRTGKVDKEKQANSVKRRNARERNRVKQVSDILVFD